MAKVRVYELARELEVDSKTLILKLKELKIEVSGHQSALTAVQVNKVKEGFASSAKKVVVRRRRKAPAPTEATSIDPSQGAEPELGLSSEEEEAKATTQASLHIVESGENEENGEAVLQSKEVSSREEQKKPNEALTVDKESVDSKQKVVEILADKQSDELVKPLSETVQVNKVTREKVEEEFRTNKSSETKEEIFKSDKILSTSKKINQHAPIGKREDSVIKKVLASDPSREEADELSSKLKSFKSEAIKSSEQKKSDYSGGATIIRKATPQEIEETKARGSNPKRKTEVRFAKRQAGSPAPSGEYQRPRTSSYSRTETSFPKQNTASSADTTEHTENKKPDFKKRGKEKYGAKETNSDKTQSTTRAGDASRRIRTKDLIRDISGSSEVAEVDDQLSSLRRRRKTVYTPTSGSRSRDSRKKSKPTHLKSTQITTPRAAYRVIRIEGAHISVGDFAKQLSIKSGELIKKLMAQGVMATINEKIDYDTASLIASEYNYECKNVARSLDAVLEQDKIEYGKSLSRAPIVTVMGHVDHGKTSILDAIRKTNVIAGESGGITQHIGAYKVNNNNFPIAFLDTPGHEAFSAMRARGAQLTDIIVLVVAADDGVKQQTIEAISHAKEAGVPIIVAVNKIDKPSVNFDRVYSELSEHGVQVEDWGGEVQSVKMSALKRQGINELLESIQLQAELLELKAGVEGRASGCIIEANLDKGRGPIASLMVTQGTLKLGDYLAAGQSMGRVRAMISDQGKPIKEAGPSTPVQILGLDTVPMSGDLFQVSTSEKMAREAALYIKSKNESESHQENPIVTMDSLLSKVSSGEVPVLSLVIKADTQGSLEAITSSLAKLNHEQVKNVIVHKGVGGVNESDCNLALTSGAIIIAFNVRARAEVTALMEKQGQAVRYFSIIYELIDVVKDFMVGKLPPVSKEVVQGHAEVRTPIHVPKIGTVAGSAVLDGKITRTSKMRLIRDDIVIYEGKVSSLRRFKEDVKEVQHGYECGISIEGYNDIHIGDRIETYIVEQEQASLEL